MSHYVYNSDDGTAYKVRAPVWVAGLQTATAATTEPTIPKGYKTRRRFLRNTSSGKEHSVVVMSASDTLYTSAFGTAYSIPTLGSGTATALVGAGRTGEKDRAI
jgi:hypothetical protein